MLSKDALYLSSEIWFTIGFGVDSIYFEGCWTPFVVMIAQMTLGYIVDALVSACGHAIRRGSSARF